MATNAVRQLRAADGNLQLAEADAAKVHPVTLNP
jgi:hypothetical protein